ncbi:MAG: polyisoprenoid-binding protein, partial [Ignavibacteriae bacterium]|nr:polyisoprenoid-binding protein [Ignavibacteriota bacterium]
MKTLTVLLFALLVAVGSLTAQTTWKGDKAHSRVEFTVTHLLISEVTGRFTDFDATLEQGADDFSGSKVQATIRTASVNTDNEFRDKDLRSDNFFNADSFPTITFKSTKFEKTGKDTYLITGDLTIRNITKSVVLNAVLKGQYSDSKGHAKAGFKATTTIDRFEFGIKWNRTIETGGLVASKEV